MKELKTENIINNIDEIVDHLSQKLKVPAEKIYSALKGEVKADFIMSCIWMFLGLCFIPLFIYGLSLPTQINYFGEESWGILKVCLTVISPCVCFVSIFINLETFVNILVAREAYTFRCIKRLIE